MASAALVSLFVASCARSSSAPGPGASLDVADAALANGAPALALSVAQTEAASHPGNAAILLREARAEVALHRREDALRMYDRAIVIDPDLRPAEMELGKIVLFTDPTRSRALFTRVLVSDPTDAAALNDRGVALDMLGLHADAQSDYRAAIAADPDQVSAKVNLALSLAIVGNSVLAVQQLRPFATGPLATPRIRQDLALLLVRAGRDKEAADLLRGDMSADEAASVVARDRRLLPGAASGLTPDE